MKHPYWTAIGVIVSVLGIIISSYLSIEKRSLSVKKTQPKLSKENLEIWIFYYFDSDFSGKNDPRAIKGEFLAYKLKDILFKHGFSNIFPMISPYKSKQLIIEHVNNVPLFMLSEIRSVITNTYSQKYYVVEKSSETVGFNHPSVTIRLGSDLLELPNNVIK